MSRWKSEDAKKEVIRLYLLGWPSQRISDSTSISKTHIARLVKAAGVRRSKEEHYKLRTARKVTKASLTVEQMITLYASGSTLAEIGKIAGISDRHVGELLDKAGHKRRTIAEARENHVELSEELIELVDGLMLGDGFISKISPHIQIAQSEPRREYLEFVQTEMERLGLTTHWYDREGCEGVNGPNDRVINRDDAGILTSHAFVELRPQRPRWYNEFDLKVVPKDVRLTPKSLVHFHCGDGSCILDKTTYKIKLSTHDFLKSDVEYLSDKIYEIYGLRFHVSHSWKNLHPNSFVMWLYKQEEVREYCRLIRHLVPHCCQYKLLPV